MFAAAGQPELGRCPCCPWTQPSPYAVTGVTGIRAIGPPPLAAKPMNDMREVGPVARKAGCPGPLSPIQQADFAMRITACLRRQNAIRT
jgi:hypothetical protein